MTDDGRIVTTNFPGDLASRMDEVAGRIDRSKSWIVREAVIQWLAEEERRFELEAEALNGVNGGRTISHDDLKMRSPQMQSAA